MENIFLGFLNRSIVAGWMILAIIVMRFLLKHAPKWIHCLLWGMVAVRLICPISFESIFSLVPSRETVLPAATAETAPASAGPLFHSGISFMDNAVNPVLRESITAAPERNVNPLQTWLFIGSVIWAAGAAVLLLYALVNYARLWFRTRTAVRLEGRVMLSEFVDTPFILGVFRPRIYLPSDMTKELKDPVVAHELVHLKRHDNLWKITGYVLLAAYWFHPLCWVAYILLCRDIELACDERVINGYDMQQKKAYSEALLVCSMDRHVTLACPLAFGEVGVKERIKCVIHYKKPAFWVMAAAMITCVIAAVCFLTDPVKGAEREVEVLPANAGNNGGETGEENDSLNPMARFMSMDWNEIRSRNLHVSEDHLYYGESDIVCIGEIPEADIRIYGYGDSEYSSEGVAIEIGDDVNYFDWIYTSPQGILPDCYWNAQKQQLQLALRIYTGTGANAQELHVLQYHKTGALTDNSFTLSDYWELLEKRIDFTFDEGTGLLVLFDTRDQKELAAVKTEGENVDSLELGDISDFLLGDNIWLSVLPGYYMEGGFIAEYPEDMPRLEAELILLESEDEIRFELGEIRVGEK